MSEEPIEHGKVKGPPKNLATGLIKRSGHVSG